MRKSLQQLHRSRLSSIYRRLIVGGGNGYTTLHMQRRGYDIALLEPTLAACKNGKKRGIHKVICGTLDKESVKDNSIKQILLLDVLEHIADDAQFLRIIYEKMAHGGRLLLTVPAFQTLWSSEDETAGHYRRYTMDKLKALCINTGFCIDYENYFMEFLFLPILLVRVGMEKIGLLKAADKRSSSEKKAIAEKQFKERRGLTRIALDILEHAEMDRLTKNKKVRFGSSIICVLRKE